MPNHLRSPWGRIIALLWLCGAVAACGQTPSQIRLQDSEPGTQATAAPLPRRQVATKRAALPASSQQPKSTVQAAPAPAPSAAPDPGEAAALLAAAKDKAESFQTFRMTMRVMDIRTDGQDSRHLKTLVTYRSPGTYRVDVRESNNPLAVGTTTLYHVGDATLTIRPGGLLSLARLTPQLTDGRVVSANNWTPDKLLYHTTLSRFDETYTVSLMGQAKLAGQPVSVLKVSHPQNPLDPQIAYERLVIDQDHLVRLWNCYSQPTAARPDGLLYQREVEQYEADPTLAADIFSL